MYDVLTKLTNEGILIGFNYWGGWAGTGESILNGDLTVNEYGKLLGEYFGTETPIPVPTPTPTPIPAPVSDLSLGDKAESSSFYELLVKGKSVGYIKVYNKPQ